MELFYFFLGILSFNFTLELPTRSSSKSFLTTKRELEILYVFGGKASEESVGAYEGNRKREAKDFEKVYNLTGVRPV